MSPNALFIPKLEIADLHLPASLITRLRIRVALVNLLALFSWKLEHAGLDKLVSLITQVLSTLYSQCRAQHFPADLDSLRACSIWKLGPANLERLVYLTTLEVLLPYQMQLQVRLIQFGLDSHLALSTFKRGPASLVQHASLIILAT